VASAGAWIVTARTHATIHAKARSGPRVEIQVRSDRHGTPALWVREESSAPALVVGRRALVELHSALERLLRTGRSGAGGEA
jgi:hypothetical protein